MRFFFGTYLEEEYSTAFEFGNVLLVINQLIEMLTVLSVT